MIKIVYILGSGHCGATILDQVLGAHSQVMGVGEMSSARPEAVCSCGRPARECPLWPKVLGSEPWPRQEVSRSKWGTLFHRGPYISTVSGAIIDEKTFIDSTVEQYRRLVSLTGKSIIIDSSKEAERVELLSRHPEIEPIVIHMVRDGRASTWSYLRKYKQLWPFLVMWMNYNLKIELFRRRFRGNYIFLRYEDFADNPEKAIRSVCEKLGISYEPDMLNFGEKEHHQIEGNRTRFVPGSKIYRDDKWKKDMPIVLRWTCTLLFGWLNFYYRRIK